MAIIAGLAFGAAYAAYHYRQDKVRHKLTILEMENRHLAELASREKLLRETTRNLDYNGTLLPDQEVALYRITQEALSNIQKHAGARKVEITLSSTPDETRLTIRDDGRGFEPNEKTGGNGLANMAARARQSGGRLAIMSRPGQGTTITASY